MASQTILIIRHAEKPAEKPEDPPTGPGLAILGEKNDHSLVIRGWQRAGAWAALFGGGFGGPDYPRPDALYAADPHKTATEDNPVSKRPWETIVPLCDRLGSSPVTQFGVGDEKPMLGSVLQSTGTVLICWEHKKIAEVILPELASRLPISADLLPSRWPRLRFDVVLRFDRADGNGDWSFRQLFPCLLAGDSNAPL